MRVQSLIILSLMAVASAPAQKLTPISTAAAELSAGAATREASAFATPRTKVAAWIWSDKYTYTAGESLTLKWTVKPNNDLYPYTIFAYRVNNQTGVKSYLPGGTSAATDIFGNTAEQGFQPTVLTAATKAVLVGAGGRFPAVTIPNELGMHTIVVQLCDYTGTRAVKTMYMKIGVVKGTTVVTGDISANRTLTNDTRWDISGIVYVKNNATLTIEPGTFVFGRPGTTPASAIIVTQNGKIMADGTKSRPIIMTSSQPFGQRARGDWGGLVMLGKAPINVGGNIVGGGTCGTDGCKNPPGTFYIEGLVGNPDSLYGGTDNNHSCGVLRYVRVEYAGTILSPNNELNSYTWGGCGKGTVSEHLQSIYGKDDMFEWFGGSNDAKWLVGGLGADDFTDFQLGWTGRVQFGMMYQSPDAPGNRGVEGDNSEYDQAATPFSNPQIYNVSYFGSGNPGFDEADSPGLFLRRGSRGTFNNLLFSNFYSPCVSLADASTQAQATAGNISMNGILCWNNALGTKGANNPAGQLSSNAFTLAFGNGTNSNANGKNFVYADPLTARPFEYSDPDWFSLFGSPVFRQGFVQPPDDGFFDQSARFIGGMGDEDWTEEWTSWLTETDIQ